VAQEHNYKVRWEYNPPEQEVTHYNIFWVELSDTLQTPFVPDVLPDAIREYQVGSPLEVDLKAANPDTAIFYFIQQENGRWIQAAATAVNARGESDSVAVSKFYKKPYLFRASKVTIIDIGR
jgi:hypothetical protein